MKKFILMFALAFTAVALPLSQTGCKSSSVTVAAGGVYSDPVLAVADQSILDTSAALTGFVQWVGANSGALVKYPEVTALAATITQQKDGWIKSAYSARDAYASAAADYKAAKAGSSAATVSATQAALNGALAVLSNVTTQITAYKAAHPNAN